MFGTMIRSFIPITVASALGYKCFNLLLDFDILSPPNKYAGKERHRWRNAATSLVNAVIVAALVMYCLFTQPELWSEPVTHYAVSVEVTFAVVSGYLIYDTYDLLTHNGFGKVWALFVHHTIMTSTFFVMSIEHKAMGILTLGLLSEINAIFLHSRQLLLMHGFSKDTLIYGVHRLFNLATYILLRLAPLIYATYCSYFTTQHLPAYLAAVLPFMTTAITVINFVLLWRLICSDFLSKDGKHRHVMDN
ncbi:TLC domain-containing protein 2-like [Acanthaster planci]|uniref:TLC domain-containing protein 2-like n=1 Tax=Acanthaster planci TaxID=133434 RepID=A0A8B7ZDJ9_ACAPL|nr:TLC domain-containing protein 2-like [Acanthaster planci]